MRKIYCIHPSPILNTPDFTSVFGGKKGHHLLVDEKGHIRSLEFISLKGEVFSVIKKISNNIFQVIHPYYPIHPLYIDIRFFSDHASLEKKPRITHEIVLQSMIEKVGQPYLWGGNWSQGIFQILKHYPPQKKLTNPEIDQWTLKGLDCSGLLYEATQGLTPRNSNELNQFGTFITNAREKFPNIQKKIRPLDMILLQGHVIFIIDQNICIESRENQGVVISPLEKRLEEIEKTSNCKDIKFTIRRISFF